MMSQYLLNIAARNTGNYSNALLPSTPVFNNPDTGIRQDPGEANDIQDVQPVTTQKNQLAVVLNETETGLTQTNTETSYFSKHIERAYAEKENSPVKNKAPETISFNIDEGAPQAAAKNTGATQNLNEPVFINKKVSKIIPEKKGTRKETFEKQIIQPSDKTDEVQNKKANPSDKLQTERITPKQPDQLGKMPVQHNKMNEAAPKLVIGKITVEILPPKLPVPQKVITRVVQSSSKDSYSKSNKLIFGLGQL